MTNRWLPDVSVGVAVLLVGIGEVASHRYVLPGLVALTIIALVALAAGCFRLAPGYALALTYLVGVLHLVTGTQILVTELALLLVSFGCARWGSRATVWLSGLSIPVGTVLGGIFVARDYDFGLARYLVIRVLRVTDAAGVDFVPWLVFVVGGLMLTIPWLAGLLFRALERARVSQEQEEAAVASKEQAEEIAALREQQTRMAHDVHDVVGHSLAVILAQAESAQFLPDDDPARLKETMANIAVSARQSLRDVRQVLSSGDAPAESGGLDRLVDGVRAAGHDVRSTVLGAPRPLPPELESVAYRTLQEMLTNAIKHGRRDQPVTVVRHWGEELTIAVENVALEPTDDTAGLGLAGMRHRVESVGGRLEVRREGDIFTATAWLPVRHGMLAL